MEEARKNLIKKNLRITPQRIAVYDAIMQLNNHPTAENVFDVVKTQHPNIALGTIYKVLDVLVEHNLIRKVKTDKDHVRYDAIMEPHHHLYCYESDRIEDYFDPDLNELISSYFKKKDIPNFRINDVKLQIIGHFKK